jgi:peptidyl-prolyl cis-trans isomerase A (cyclophilin A)
MTHLCAFLLLFAMQSAAPPIRSAAPSVVSTSATTPVSTSAAPITADADEAAAAKLVHVLLRTEMGDIEIEVDGVHAPATAANFLRYVDAGHYNHGSFHRTVRRSPDNQKLNRVKIEVIQAGAAPERQKEAFLPIRLERTVRTGLHHKDGTVSMARSEPDSATSDFFICVGDQPELDSGGKRNPDGLGFAAFGRVVRGMDVVRRILAAPSDGQKLTPPVTIVEAHRIAP